MVISYSPTPTHLASSNSGENHVEIEWDLPAIEMPLERGRMTAAVQPRDVAVRYYVDGSVLLTAYAAIADRFFHPYTGADEAPEFEPEEYPIRQRLGQLDKFYRSPSDNLSPGDLFSNAPSVYLRDEELTILRRRQGRQGPLADLYVLGDEERTPQQGFDPNDDEVAARLQRGHGILITHGCEIDNRPKACAALALVRPMRLVPTESAMNQIRQGRNLSFLWLPPNDDPPFEESYVDFSRITSVRHEVLHQRDKLVSASEELVKALFLCVVRYYTRWEMSNELLNQLVESAGDPEIDEIDDR